MIRVNKMFMRRWVFTKRERLLVFTIRWKKYQLHQVEQRYAAAVAAWLCREQVGGRLNARLSGRTERKEEDLCKIFHSSRERQGEKGRARGGAERNTDHVLWESISAATNGCSEKGELKGQQLGKWAFCPKETWFNGEFKENMRVKNVSHSFRFKRLF